MEAAEALDAAGIGDRRPSVDAAAVLGNEALGATDRSTRVTRTIGTTSGALGSFPAILFAILFVVLWAAEGVIVVASRGGDWAHFLDPSYQLQINSTTTIFTFWMAFVIQNTQNRDGRAIQTKLDAIIEHLGCDAQLVALENAPEKEIKAEQDRVHRGR